MFSSAPKRVECPKKQFQVHYVHLMALIVKSIGNQCPDTSGEFVRDSTRLRRDLPLALSWLSTCPATVRSMDSGRPIRVLIVDDNRVDRELYKQCLQMSPSARFEFAES